eukprot:2162976-Amphidinium_carterae.1
MCLPSTGAIAAGPCTTAAALGRLGMMPATTQLTHAQKHKWTRQAVPAMAASCGHVKSGSS